MAEKEEKAGVGGEAEGAGWAGALAAPDVAEVSIELQEALDRLAEERRASRRQLRWALRSSILGGLALAAQLWGSLRGETILGWLFFNLCAAFTLYFGARWRRGARAVASLEEEVRALELKQDHVADETEEGTGHALPGEDSSGAEE